MNRRKLPLLTLLLGLAALPLLAGGEWYDEYDKGVNACNAGDFGSCENHMKQAIGMKPASEANARTYGMEFKSYTPYYYLGLVATQRGDNAKASQYFEKEANFGVIYKTPNNASFVMMRKQLQNAQASAPPAEDPAKKEADRLAAEKAAQEKKALEEKLAASEAEKKRLADEAAAAKNNVASNVRPASNPVVRPPPVTPSAVPPPAVVVAAPKDNSSEAMQEVGRRAVSMILKGDLGSACASLEQDGVKPHFDKQPGYYLLLSYAYYLRSFNQPDRKTEFETQAKEYVKKASRINASLTPDDKLFSPKFVAFYKNNI